MGTGVTGKPGCGALSAVVTSLWVPRRDSGTPHGLRVAVASEPGDGLRRARVDFVDLNGNI